MVVIQRRSKRKPTGGRYHAGGRGKRRFEMGRRPTLTRLEETKNKVIKVKGGRTKTKLLTSKTANLLDTKTNKHVKATIETVIETPANRHFARRNIITKGTIIQTDKGKAKVTSRPGQDGIVNAVIIS
jgi:small subunit ribosomal protein S8e